MYVPRAARTTLSLGSVRHDAYTGAYTLEPARPSDYSGDNERKLARRALVSIIAAPSEDERSRRTTARGPRSMRDWEIAS